MKNSQATKCGPALMRRPKYSHMGRPGAPGLSTGWLPPALPHGDLKFALSTFQSGGTGQQWGPWPYAGSFGYFGGMALGLVLVAMPWRAGKKAD